MSGHCTNWYIKWRVGTGMQVKVSIIMPSLNVKNYIEETVRSAMNQTLREIEMICIDAGSEDGTWEILSHLAETDERIILCHSDVKSYGYQVNMGIKMAKGTYVAVLETDDYVDPEMYERLYHLAVQMDCDYVKSDCFAYWTQENGERFFFKKRTFFKEELYDKVMEPKRYSETATYDWYLWPGIYKKEFLNRNNIWLSETLGAAFQDIGFIFQTNAYAKRALYIKEAYYRYCMDREGASSNSGKGLQYAYQEFDRLCRMMESSGIIDREIASALYCRMAKSMICCYEGMNTGYSGLADSDRRKYYLWFQKKLKDAIAKDIVNTRNLRPEIWDKLEILLISEECYLKKIKDHEDYIRKKIGEAKEFLVVIFGCGYYGFSAYRWLKKQGYSIAAFMDNNKALWGTKVNGIMVEPPVRAKEMPDEVKYLIANEMYSGEIKEQLLALGISDNMIGNYV